MKTRIIIVALMLVSVTAFAQKKDFYSPFFKQGLVGYASVGGATFVTRHTTGSEFAPSAGIGYAFGQGTYLGVGTTYYVHSGDEHTIPIFAEVRHSFLKKSLISPFADLKTGYVFTKPSGSGFLMCPGIGVDVSRFFFEFSFSYDSGKKELLENHSDYGKYDYKNQLLMMSVGVSFKIASAQRI
ncbi:MAG: hypothetical protein WCR48_04120 [Bacteroidales bacterium]